MGYGSHSSLSQQKLWINLKCRQNILWTEYNKWRAANCQVLQLHHRQHFRWNFKNKIPLILIVLYHFLASPLGYWDVAKYHKDLRIWHLWNFNLINLPGKEVEALSMSRWIAAQTGKEKSSLKGKSRLTDCWIFWRSENHMAKKGLVNANLHSSQQSSHRWL